MAGFLLGALFSLVFGYVCGSIPFGFLIGKFNGIDIRRYGSGNIGATNVRRVLGKGWGRFCFILDFLKGFLPVLVLSALTDSTTQPVQHAYYPALAAAGAVAGHCWPFWLGFEGGKGVATTIGALLALAPWCVVIAVAGWLAVFFLTRYVSAASLAAAVLLPVSALAMRLVRPGSVSDAGIILLTGLAILIILRHRSNIERLLSGTESRFEPKRKREATGER